MTVNIGINGKTALITGATRGIGKATAKIFLDAGAQVILTGTNSTEVEELIHKNINPQVRWVTADFSTKGDIDKFLCKLKLMGQIDVIINNSGINNIKPFMNYSIDEYQQLLNVNLIAPMLIVQSVISKMKKRRFGRIINIASIWSQISKSQRVLYTTSKTGLLGFTRSLAVEYGDSNILVNAVSPGFTLTELTEKSLSAVERQTLSDQIPLHRFASTNEIAKTVLFLASDLNTYITGQNIIIDGGFTIV